MQSLHIVKSSRSQHSRHVNLTLEGKFSIEGSLFSCDQRHTQLGPCKLSTVDPSLSNVGHKEQKGPQCCTGINERVSPGDMQVR